MDNICDSQTSMLLVDKKMHENTETLFSPSLALSKEPFLKNAGLEYASNLLLATMDFVAKNETLFSASQKNTYENKNIEETKPVMWSHLYLFYCNRNFTSSRFRKTF